MGNFDFAQKKTTKNLFWTGAQVTEPVIVQPANLGCIGPQCSAIHGGRK